MIQQECNNMDQAVQVGTILTQAFQEGCVEGCACGDKCLLE